ncbi:MAG: hypothetical protein J5666_05950, partial [Bacilli bacterium]|nr:hypothetical protein [Bacilli bacterium]
MDKVHINITLDSDLGSLELGKNLYLSKKELFRDFYGDFYNFIKKHQGLDDLLSHNIKTKEDFYKYADYYADNMENCYAMGFSFHKYFLTVEEGGSLEGQPRKTFIGYCFKNKKYLDFLNFLVSFFAYWRNDEGCTNFNPYNHADDFFNSSWAALVDTTKLFYFTSETVYHWHSYRIKYLLDHIPGCILDNSLRKKDIINGLDLNIGSALPKVRIAGYEF